MNIEQRISLLEKEILPKGYSSITVTYENNDYEARDIRAIKCRVKLLFNTDRTKNLNVYGKTKDVKKFLMLSGWNEYDLERWYNL